MTQGQQKRASYFLRSATEIADEACESHKKKRFDRVIRKTHEALELFLKAGLLQQGIEPAKSHDLALLAQPLKKSVAINEADLDFLTEQRIPAFYGAEDFIPDQEYALEDSDRCLNILRAVGLIKRIT